MTEKQEIVIRRGGGPGCIGIFLILGFIALGVEEIGRHPGIAIGIGSALLIAVGLFLWYREQNASRTLADAPPAPAEPVADSAKALSSNLPPPTPEQAAPKRQQIPPGWYADPLGNATWRWWDGESWTDKIS